MYVHSLYISRFLGKQRAVRAPRRRNSVVRTAITLIPTDFAVFALAGAFIAPYKTINTKLPKAHTIPYMTHVDFIALATPQPARQLVPTPQLPFVLTRLKTGGTYKAIG